MSDRIPLARLTLSDQAARIADGAADLVNKVNLVNVGEDDDTAVGARAKQSAELVRLAVELMSAAVIYEYERSGSWSGIASALGVSPEQVEAECGPALAAWRAKIDADRPVADA